MLLVNNIPIVICKVFYVSDTNNMHRFLLIGDNSPDNIWSFPRAQFPTYNSMQLLTTSTSWNNNAWQNGTPKTPIKMILEEWMATNFVQDSNLQLNNDHAAFSILKFLETTVFEKSSSTYIMRGKVNTIQESFQIYHRHLAAPNSTSYIRWSANQQYPPPQATANEYKPAALYSALDSPEDHKIQGSHLLLRPTAMPWRL